MSSVGNATQQLQQELQNELLTANQLLRLISVELQQIKHMSCPGGEFEENIKQNASITKSLANLQQINIDNLPPITRKQIDMSMQSNNNISYEEHNTFRNESEMDDTQ